MSTGAGWLLLLTNAGFLLAMNPLDCGGVLLPSVTHRTLQYSLLDTDSVNGTSCSWILQASPSETVELEIISYQAGSWADPSCSSAYLAIKLGATQKERRFCGLFWESVAKDGGKLVIRGKGPAVIILRAAASDMRQGFTLRYAVSVPDADRTGIDTKALEPQTSIPLPSLTESPAWKERERANLSQGEAVTFTTSTGQGQEIIPGYPSTLTVEERLRPLCIHQSSQSPGDPKLPVHPSDQTLGTRAHSELGDIPTSKESHPRASVHPKSLETQHSPERSGNSHDLGSPLTATVSDSISTLRLGSISTPRPGSISTPGLSSISTPRPGSISTPGPSSISTPGPSSISTPGPSSISTPGPSSISTPGPSSISTPGPSSISTPGPSSISTPGPSSISTPGPSSISTPGPSSISTPGPSSISTPGPSSISTPGPSSISTPGPSSISTPGPSSISTPGPSSISTPGPSSISTPGPSSISTPRTGIISTPRPGSISTPRPGSISTPRPGSISTPRPGSISTPRPGSISTPRPGSISTPRPDRSPSPPPDRAPSPPPERAPSPPPEPGSPSTPSPGSPSTPSPGSPSTPSPGSPSTPSQGSPSTPSPGSPSTPSPGSPSSPSPGSPSSPSPGSPSSPSPGSPSSPSPGSPSSPSPGSPSSPSPGSPSSPSPGSPSSPSPGSPSSPSPGSPSSPSPGSPSSPSPVSPSTRSPGSPSTRSPGSPSTRSPGSPSTRSPGSPSTRSPGSPSTRSPGSPSTRSPGSPSTRSPGSPSTRSPGSPSTRSPGSPSTRSPGSPSTPSPGSVSTPTPSTLSTRSPGSPSTRSPGSPSTRSPGSPSTRSPGSPSTRSPGSLSTPRHSSLFNPTPNSNSTPPLSPSSFSSPSPILPFSLFLPGNMTMTNHTQLLSLKSILAPSSDPQNEDQESLMSRSRIKLSSQPALGSSDGPWSVFSRSHPESNSGQQLLLTSPWTVGPTEVNTSGEDVVTGSDARTSLTNTSPGQPKSHPKTSEELVASTSPKTDQVSTAQSAGRIPPSSATAFEVSFVTVSTLGDEVSRGQQRSSQWDRSYPRDEGLSAGREDQRVSGSQIRSEAEVPVTPPTPARDLSAHLKILANEGPVEISPGSDSLDRVERASTAGNTPRTKSQDQASLPGVPASSSELITPPSEQDGKQENESEPHRTFFSQATDIPTSESLSTQSTNTQKQLDIIRWKLNFQDSSSDFDGTITSAHSQVMTNAVSRSWNLFEVPELVAHSSNLPVQEVTNVPETDAETLSRESETSGHSTLHEILPAVTSLDGAGTTQAARSRVPVTDENTLATQGALSTNGGSSSVSFTLGATPTAVSVDGSEGHMAPSEMTRDDKGDTGGGSTIVAAGDTMVEDREKVTVFIFTKDGRTKMLVTDSQRLVVTPRAKSSSGISVISDLSGTEKDDRRMNNLRGSTSETMVTTKLYGKTLWFEGGTSSSSNAGGESTAEFPTGVNTEFGDSIPSTLSPRTPAPNSTKPGSPANVNPPPVEVDRSTSPTREMDLPTREIFSTTLTITSLPGRSSAGSAGSPSLINPRGTFAPTSSKTTMPRSDEPASSPGRTIEPRTSASERLKETSAPAMNQTLQEMTVVGRSVVVSGTPSFTPGLLDLTQSDTGSPSPLLPVVTYSDVVSVSSLAQLLPSAPTLETASQPPADQTGMVSSQTLGSFSAPSGQLGTASSVADSEESALSTTINLKISAPPSPAASSSEELATTAGPLSPGMLQVNQSVSLPDDGSPVPSVTHVSIKDLNSDPSQSAEPGVSEQWQRKILSTRNAPQSSTAEGFWTWSQPDLVTVEMLTSPEVVSNSGSSASPEGVTSLSALTMVPKSVKTHRIPTTSTLSKVNSWTPSRSSSWTPSRSSSWTPSRSSSWTPSRSSSWTPSRSSSWTPSGTNSWTPSRSSSWTPSRSSSWTPSGTNSWTPSGTNSWTPNGSSSWTPSRHDTSITSPTLGIGTLASQMPTSQPLQHRADLTPSSGNTETERATRPTVHPHTPGTLREMRNPVPSFAPSQRQEQIFILENQPPLIKEGVAVKIPSKLVLDMNFSLHLRDPKSEDYQNLAEDFTQKVSPFYKKVPGFQQLLFKRFSAGSVLIEFDAVFIAKEIRAYLLDPDSIFNITGLCHEIAAGFVIGGARVMRMYVTEDVIGLCGEVFSCQTGFQCIHSETGNVSCTSLCHVDYCKNSGICTHNRGQEPMCQCPVGSDYWFMGPRCDHKMTQQGLIGIAFGVVLSFVVVMAAVAIAVLRRFKILLIEAKIDQTRSSYRRFSRFDDFSNQYRPQSWFSYSVSSLDNPGFSNSDELIHLQMLDSSYYTCHDESMTGTYSSRRTASHGRSGFRHSLQNNLDVSIGSINEHAGDSGKASDLSVCSWPVEPLPWSPFPILYQLSMDRPFKPRRPRSYCEGMELVSMERNWTA
ncbi:mucin-2 [Heptranchias perlo]|uniref:mucin-2 n=1 Tax=Heptranchias perlo TaxID=212740 RepID=UPI0035596A8E